MMHRRRENRFGGNIKDLAGMTTLRENRFGGKTNFGGNDKFGGEADLAGMLFLAGIPKIVAENPNCV